MSKHKHPVSYRVRCTVCRTKTVQVPTDKVRGTMAKLGWKEITPTSWSCPNCAKTLEKQANSVGYTSIFEEI